MVNGDGGRPDRPSYLVMPLWQGSPSSRAMQLIDGAEAIREDLPASASQEVPVPLEAGDSLGTPVSRLSSVLQARDAARSLISELPEPVITLGGDGSSTLAGLSRAAGRHPDGALAVLWISARPALQHPSVAPTGAASAMTLRFALGDGVPDLAFGSPLLGAQVALLGARELDDEEAAEADRCGVVRLAEPVEASLRDFLAEGAFEALYVHLDLDALDPAEIHSVHTPVPFGLRSGDLSSLIREAVGAVPLAGAAICGYAPGSSEDVQNDQPTVLRLLAALTSGANGSNRANGPDSSTSGSAR